MSVAKGYVDALDYAQRVGCECMQVFAKSPRQWRAAPLDRDHAHAFELERTRRGGFPLFTHTAYLINLTTSDDDLREKSVLALADELTRGSLLGADGVVTHLGNDPLGDAPAAAERCADAILRARALAASTCDPARLLLENTAGAGRTFGGPLSELAAVITHSGLDADAVGVCFDTCHAFAYGYPISDARGWSAVADEIDEAIGLDRLGLIHANDCMFECGSRKDRHAWIGEGHIGEAGFRAMLCEPRLVSACVVTEMPGEAPEKDRVNVERLRVLRETCA